jgi:hypothetical protein
MLSLCDVDDHGANLELSAGGYDTAGNFSSVGNKKLPYIRSTGIRIEWDRCHRNRWSL